MIIHYSNCKTLAIRIRNGRLGKMTAKLVNGPTCKDTRVVDYVITSPVLMPAVTKFEVGELHDIWYSIKAGPGSWAEVCFTVPAGSL